MPKFISINASYSIKGGADRFFTELNSLLRKNGHQVVTFTTAPDNISDVISYPAGTYFTKNYKENSGLFHTIENLIRIFHSFRIASDLKKVLKKEKTGFCTYSQYLS